ncbi:type II secretion system protein J [Planctomycetota bacterium]
MRNNSRHQSNRRGISLLHMTLAMTLMAILLGSAMTIITQVMDAELVMRRDVQWTTLAVQLDEELRSDAHRATEVETSDDQILFRMANGEHVSYRMESTSTSKALRRVESASGNELITQDSYQLPFDSTTEWEKHVGPTNHEFVEFKIEREAVASASSRRLFHAVARLNAAKTDGDIP